MVFKWIINYWELNNFIYFSDFPIHHNVTFTPMTHNPLTIRILPKHIWSLYSLFLHLNNNNDKLDFLLMLNFFTLVYLNIKVSMFSLLLALNFL
jgi:hypothetical protein